MFTSSFWGFMTFAYSFRGGAELRSAPMQCIDIIHTIWYNQNMEHLVKFYEIHSISGLTFRFKLDLNPITKLYEPHIWHRHQLEPEDVIAAYLNLTYTTYNHKHKRYEGFSEFNNINIFYNFLAPNKTKIMIITAFKL